MTLAIIGAGIAGLACATRLADAGREVRLFDKGRGAGGRMATRRLELDGTTVTFDHGAQYLTARDPRFAQVLEQWARCGLVAPWPAAGPEAWVGVPGMNAPIRALAEPHRVAWGQRVEHIAYANDQWHLDGDARQTFDTLVLAIPAEQAAAMLGATAPDLAQLAAAVQTLPCWTMFAAFDAPLPLPQDVIRGPDDAALTWAARDSAKPGRAPGERWVVQAGAAWSHRHLEDDAAAVAERLLQALAVRAGAALIPRTMMAHRWRYARTTATAPAMLWDADRRLGLCGDWCRGARVEDAWLSGDALAQAILLSV